MAYLEFIILGQKTTKGNLFQTFRPPSILLKRSLEPVVRISLYYQIQTHADSEIMYRLSLNFQRIFSTSPSPISVESNRFRNTFLTKNTKR